MIACPSQGQSATLRIPSASLPEHRVGVPCWDMQWSQEKTKTMLNQNLGGQKKSIMVFSTSANYKGDTFSSFIHVKGGAYYYFCAYVLRISRYSDFLSAVLNNTEIDVIKRVNKGRITTVKGYFCTVQNYAEKTQLRKFSWYLKRKLGVTIHFSEIIKLQLGKELHTLICILNHFTNIVD